MTGNKPAKAERTHNYSISLIWTGNLGDGTQSYDAYSREYDIAVEGKPKLTGSADPAFRGDAALYNPEDLLVASLSSCHMLWYVHLCAVRGVVVDAYEDDAEGEMVEGRRGGYFTRVTLRPTVTVRAGSDEALARELHHEAHARCFIANSVNFPVECEPKIVVAAAA